MRKLMIATCCVALMAAASTGAAMAQTTGPSGQDTMKTDNTANAQNKMHKKKTMKKTSKTKKMHSSMRKPSSGTVGMSRSPDREDIDRGRPAPGMFEPADRGSNSWIQPDAPGAPDLPAR